MRFCSSLSALCGLEEVYSESSWQADFTKNGFYLPTEAQWEYAAGGPNHYSWSLGDTFIASDYVYDDSQTRPVKSHPANEFGLRDMTGNVWEYCHDWYGDTFPWTGEQDPNGPTNGSARVARGGSWGDFLPEVMRCDYRSGFGPPGTGSSIGFRVAIGGHGLWQ